MPAAMIRAATVRMLGAARWPDPGDPVGAADRRTSMSDLRAAVNLARGFAADELNPATGYQTLDSMLARRFKQPARKDPE